MHAIVHPPARPSAADELLRLARTAADRIPAAHVAVVVAHPDDETIGCGALLARLGGASVIVVTDGAPRNLHDARAHGFASAQAYAAARSRELQQALALAAVPEDRLVCLDIPDQQAAHRLSEITAQLIDVFAARGTTVVLTHAYEGGHPDHDATAFAVHAAARAGARVPAVIEMPYYRGVQNKMVTQRFAADPDAGELVIALDERARALKKRMLEAHATQQRTLSLFCAEVERFRRAPAYDFRMLPNGGELLYEWAGLGLTGAEWLRLATAALDRFELGQRACA
ncbi:MAG TPA: PIG-L family deacetylase [Xanthobacteraceae bacterium]